MPEKLVEAQAEIAGEEVEGQAGGGSVKVRATGAGDVTAIRIDPRRDAIDDESCYDVSDYSAG